MPCIGSLCYSLGIASALTRPCLSIAPSQERLANRARMPEQIDLLVSVDLGASAQLRRPTLRDWLYCSRTVPPSVRLAINASIAADVPVALDPSSSCVAWMNTLVPSVAGIEFTRRAPHDPRGSGKMPNTSFNVQWLQYGRKSLPEDGLLLPRRRPTGA